MAVPITLGGNKFTPSTSSNRLLERNGLLDLSVLELNERVLLVSIGVVGSKNLQGSLGLVLRHEPSRRLGDQPKGSNLDNGGKCLH